jgi:hypothetical protein
VPSPSDAEGLASSHLRALDLRDGMKGRASGDREERESLWLEGGGAGSWVVAGARVAAGEEPGRGSQAERRGEP